MGTIWTWISTHLTDAYLLGVAEILKNEYFIVTCFAVPFLWPAIRWVLRKWAAFTPWKDDDTAVERLDALVQEKVDGRLGYPAEPVKPAE